MGLNERKLVLVNALHALGNAQNVVEDTHGNVSCIDDDRKGMVIKGSGVPYEKANLSTVVHWNFDDGSYEGDTNPSVDSIHHAEIYKRNEWVKSICHTHSPYATALAMANTDIPVCCTEHADYFGMAIEVIPGTGIDSWGQIDLVDNEGAVLLRNHGILTFSSSSDAKEAVKLAIALEMIAKKFVLAMSVRTKFSMTLSTSIVDTWHERYQSAYGQKNTHRK